MAKAIENNLELAKLSGRAKEFYDIAVSRYIEKHAKNVDFLDEYLDEREKGEFEELQRQIKQVLSKN